MVGKIRIAMRIAAGRKLKVGHAGTLDPLATGLLIMAYGPFTKKLPPHHRTDKTYTGTITLGSVTPSYDLETEPEQHRPLGAVGREPRSSTPLPSSIGELMQRPPNFSAKRFEGERAYWLARDEERAHLVELASRRRC